MNLIPRFVKDALRRNLANPSQDVLRLFGGSPSAAGVEVNENTCMSVSSVFACVRNIAEDCAKLPFVVYEDLEPAGRRKVKGHPMWRLLSRKPNPEMIPFECRQAVTANAVLWGNGYAEIERNGAGLPIALWPIQSWRVQARRRPNGQLYYLVDGKAEVEPRDMFRIGGFGNNGIVGFMMARLAKDSFGLAMAAERFAATYFGNGTKPGGTIETPGLLTEQAQRNLRESIEGAHQGPDRAHRIMILEAGLKYTEGSINAEEAQALESRQFQFGEEVPRWFRMPQHKIGNLSKATFANIEHQAIEYVTDCLMPWLEKWEQEAVDKLCQPSETTIYGKHDVNALLRGDTVSRADANSKLVLACIKKPNEARMEEGLNPTEDGDELLVPANFTTLDGLLAAAQTARAEAAQASAAAGITDEEAKEGEEDAPATATPGTEGEARDDDLPVTPEIPQDEVQAEPGDNTEIRPPPEGVVPPGQQPGLDSTFTGFRRLAKLSVTDSLRRVLRVEADKLTRAAKRPAELRSFVDTFYPAHLAHVRATISPALTVYAESVAEARGLPFTAELREKVEALVGQLATRHVGDSRLDVADPDGLEQRVELWGEYRAEPFADAALDEVGELVRA